MKRFTDPADCVEALLARVGRRIVLGTPLGLGKANHVVNELYRHAEEDPGIELTIFTALTLSRPEISSELERRLAGPIVERIFGDYPELAYARPMARGELPDNIRARQFYFQAGKLLDSAEAQRGHVSSNYTHVARDLRDAGMNVLAQLVGSDPEGEDPRYSLSSNPDLTVDLLPWIEGRRAAGEPFALVGQVNRRLPYMTGDALLEPGAFDLVLDDPALDFELPAPPDPEVTTADHLIGLHASALVRDGGTLQLGIGALGDAVVYALRLRHEENADYRAALADTGALDRFGDAVERVGGADPFDEGLYAATEMLVDGFLDLHDSGILSRRVWDDLETQRRFGGPGVAADEAPPGGAVAHAGLFLGPRRFYQRLRELPSEARGAFRMTGISRVNELYGSERLKRLQRRHARFVNSALKVTLLGAVASDALEDGRVLSGVGGQYNFVAMAHALEDGRSILMLPAVRESGGRAESNVVWSYGHTTIPRHLRDFVVTEYGIADLRGRPDHEVVAALVGIADSRFQEGLVAEAKRAGKLPSDWRLPDGARENTPERLERALAPQRARGRFGLYPFGTDLTHEELTLKRALGALKEGLARKRPPVPGLRQLAKVVAPPAEAAPYLERMELDRPRSVGERLLRRAVLWALAADGAI